MMRTKNNFFIFFILLTVYSYGAGVEVLNYYIEVPENNTYKTYFEYEKKGDFEYLKYKVGTGVLKVNEKWKLDYDIERKYEKNVNSKGWENTFYLYKKLSDKKYFNKTWTRDVGPYIKMDMVDLPKVLGQDYKENKYGGKYRIRTSTDLGLGDMYWGADFISVYTDTLTRDGYELQGNITGSATLGYGFQDFFTIYNEYLDHSVYEGTYLLRFENLFRWTYELGENMVFSIDFNLDSYNYMNSTDIKKSFKVDIGPYLQYNRYISDDFRVFFKGGFFGYSYETYETDALKITDKGNHVKIDIGIEYIW